jgi:tripartite-type tricarboxylate transporter receptor subunit TctC
MTHAPRRRHICAVLVAATIATGLAAPVIAQEAWPQRPIRIVVGYSAGGGNDIIARLVATKMSEGLGQQVIIENRPGAASIIACEQVARATPDGYTLIMSPTGPFSINPAIYPKLNYSPTRDFVPISIVGTFPLILGVSAASPIRSVPELVEFARKNPGKANYASSATPFQLAAELFNIRTGTRFAHIPYKGSGDSVNAVIAQEVTMTISDSVPIAGPAKAGRLRALAVTAAQRHPSFPDVPTMAEAGIADMEISLQTGFSAPAGTPRAIVKRLEDEIARVIRLPDIRERLAQLGIDAASNTSEEYAKMIATDLARWTQVAQTAGVKAQQ